MGANDYGQRGAPIRLAIFSDRIEIENPGGLPPGLTIEDILRGVSKLRNRVIGRVFYDLGLIELWGSGIQRMADACRQAGLAPPEFEEIGTGFRVTLRRARGTPELDAVDRQILAFVRRSSAASASKVAAHIGIPPRATRDRLRRLEELALVAAVGSSARDPRRVCHIEPMKKISIREACLHLTSIDVLLAKEGEVLLTRRGQPLARIVPLHGPRRLPSQALLRSKMPRLSASEGMVRHERDER